jgi:apolipoprotein N-acyltransferase
MNNVSSVQSTLIQERESSAPVDGRVSHSAEHATYGPFDTVGPQPPHKASTVLTGVADRLSYFWFALAIVVLPFAIARWTIPLAAWLYPVFLLRFVRTQPLLRGMLFALVATTLVLVFALQGVFPIPGAFYYVAVFGTGVLFSVPYLIDRVSARRLGGMLGTLVFPSAVTTVWYLWAWLNPAQAGTWLNPAYTQYGDLPLLQLLSVTGVWGIVFLMSWLASVVNWAWEREFAWPQVRGGALLYASLLAAVLLFGGTRLAVFPPQGSTVRVAGISPSRALPPWETLAQSAFATQPDREHARQTFAQAMAPTYDDLFARSEQEARAGAKIVVWSEGRAAVFEEDQAALLARASALARSTGIYLNLAMTVLLQQPVQSPLRTILDQVALVDPSGNMVWRYEKTHPVPGPELAVTVPGDGAVPTLQTPYGRLSSAICYDLDFLDIISNTGHASADLLLVPGGDWQGIDPLHAQMATFRAIENGFSLVRPAKEGLGMAVNYEGQVLAASDYFTTDQQVIVAYVPTQGVHTLYSAIGDLFAWLSVGGLVLLIGLALGHKWRTIGTSAADPTRGPLGSHSARPRTTS